MTDNETIKGYCKRKLCPPAQEIINRQHAEIERLQAEGLQINETFMGFVNKCKAEAIKEFAERLKATDMSDTVGEQYINGEIYGYFYSNAFTSKIDNLVKEMTEQSVNYGSSKTEGNQ